MPWMKHCPACTGKNPSARTAHGQDLVEFNGEQVWAWRCENCGYVKKPRKSSKRRDYDFITHEATSDTNMSLPNRVLFHCFNPNGLYARLREMQDKIAEWVDTHPDQPNGVLLAHGSLNDFPRNAIFDLLNKRKRVDSITVAVAMSTVQRAIDNGYRWLAEKEAVTAATGVSEN